MCYRLVRPERVRNMKMITYPSSKITFNSDSVYGRDCDSAMRICWAIATAFKRGCLKFSGITLASWPKTCGRKKITLTRSAAVMFESLKNDSCTRVDLLVNWFRRAPLVETRSKRWSMVVLSLAWWAKCIFWHNSTIVTCKKIIAECIRSRYPTLGKTSSNPGILISKRWHIWDSKHRLSALKPYLVRRSLASLFKFYSNGGL